jgi:hypothetical protein
MLCPEDHHPSPSSTMISAFGKVASINDSRSFHETGTTTGSFERHRMCERKDCAVNEAALFPGREESLNAFLSGLLAGLIAILRPSASQRMWANLTFLRARRSAACALRKILPPRIVMCGEPSLAPLSFTNNSYAILREYSRGADGSTGSSLWRPGRTTLSSGHTRMPRIRRILRRPPW